MNYEEFYQLYWEHYLDLEDRLFDVDKYCYISNKNKKTYSRRFLELILSICSELDVILQKICKFTEEPLDFNNSGIYDYKRIISKHFPTFSNEVVCVIRREKNTITPFKQFATNFLPSW